MKNELYQHKKKDGVKWFVTLIAVILLAVAVTGAITQGFKNWNPYGWFEDKPKVETPKSDITDDLGNGMTDSTKVYALPKAMVFASKVNTSTPSTPLYTVNVSATITPADATYQSVDWSVAFVNPSSAWATGKLIADYVTVTPTSDGALTSAVKCFSPFGEQIKIEVVSRDNENAKASCTVDYKKRLEDVKLTVSNLNGDGGVLTNRNVAKPATLPKIKFYSSQTAQNKYNITVEPIFGVGSIVDTYTSTTNLETTSTFKQFGSYSNESAVSFPKNAINASNGFYADCSFTTRYTAFDMLVGPDDDWHMDDWNIVLKSYASGIAKSSNQDLLNFVVRFNLNNVVTTYNYYCSIDMTSFRVAVMSITVGAPIIF